MYKRYGLLILSSILFSLGLNGCSIEVQNTEKPKNHCEKLKEDAKKYMELERYKDASNIARYYQTFCTKR